MRGILSVNGALWLSLAFVWCRESDAYQTNSVISKPCHEEISASALSAAMRHYDIPIETDLSRNDRALIDDLAFPVPDELYGLEFATLALGNRHADLGGVEPSDLSALSRSQAHPNKQAQHCLRSQEDDTSLAGLRDCRAWIGERVQAALRGLKESAEGEPRWPDLSVRDEYKVVLAIRGDVTAAMPVFWFEAGFALHTIQDSFSHSFRDPNNQKRVTALLNYVDPLGDGYDPSEDGPEHSSILDECDRLDAYRQERLDLATEASRDFLLALLNPEADIQQRADDAEQVVLEYTEFVSGCDAANNFCDAPELEYKQAGCVCTIMKPRAKETAHLAGGWLGLGLVLALFTRRSQRSKTRTQRESL